MDPDPDAEAAWEAGSEVAESVGACPDVVVGRGTSVVVAAAAAAARSRSRCSASRRRARR
jgi:hypothetical protein